MKLHATQCGCSDYVGVGDEDSTYEEMVDALLPLFAEIRTAALEEAALALIGHIGIQTTNGIGWIPGDSLAGAARYLRHLARTTGVQS